MESWSSVSLSSTMLTRQSSEYSLHIEDDGSPLLDNAIGRVDLILSNQTKALTFLTTQYRESAWSIGQMKTSLRVLNNSLRSGGKIIISGMGKSYKIASKTVATLNSLRMHSALLHPSEALHGDLGMIREDHGDSLVIISASGNSPELLQMLQHTPAGVPVVLLTCNRSSTLSRHPKVVSLMLAEVPASLSETNLYGLSAPTISTTLCLALLDAVSISLSELHISDYHVRKSVFGVHHPGGAIGLDYQMEQLAVDKSGRVDCPAEKPAASAGSAGATAQDGSGPDPEKGACGAFPSVLDISELALLQKIERAPSRKHLVQLPEHELDVLRLLSLHDYLILDQDQSEDEKTAIDCAVARDVYRESHAKGDGWPQIRTRIACCGTRLKSLVL